MAFIRSVRSFAFFLALAWPAALLLAQNSEPLSPSAGEPYPGSLAGQLLVASPDIGDPRFENSVIMMIKHDRDGAFGVAINRPIEEHSIAEILGWIDQPSEGVDGKVLIYSGGPVQPSVGLVLHSGEYQAKGTLKLDKNLSVSSSPEILRDIGHHKGPQKMLVIFGYAGWGAGQLEHEMDERAWATAPADPALVFDADRAALWTKAWAKRTLNL